jgi:hypothetical protein
MEECKIKLSEVITNGLDHTLSSVGTFHFAAPFAVDKQ